MDQVAAATPDARRRTSLFVTAAIAIALAAVIWVGGGIFITICALLAELAKRRRPAARDRPLGGGRRGGLFPILSFVVLGFGIGMIENVSSVGTSSGSSSA
jgi:hypothetical protein